MTRIDDQGARSHGRSSISIVVWVAVAVLMASAAAVPPLTTHVPVGVDLPQHLAQLRLAEDVLSGQVPGDLFAVSWIAPNTAVYAVMVPLWRLAGPFWTGRVIVALLLASWVAATVVVAWKRNRPMETAILACALVFNVSLAWGLLNFLIGYPVFVAWWLTATRSLTRLRWVALLTLSGALYWCHALWFAFSCFALVVLVAIERASARERALKLTSALPVGVMSLFWVRSLSTARAERFDVAAQWTTPLFERLVPGSWGLASVYVRGWVLGVTVVVIAVWVAAALLAARRRRTGSIDVSLLAMAALAGGVALFGPDKFLNTEFFAWRWTPVALMWAIMALPPPELPSRIRAATAGVVFLLVVGHSAVSWGRMQESELSGLDRALAAVPTHSRVVGLDYVRTSRFVPGWPFLHAVAWASVLHGAETDFSFAEHGNALVRYRAPREAEWNRGISQDAHAIGPDDWTLFDYALVHLENDREHAAFVERAPVEAVTFADRWRLYRVTGRR